MRDMDREMKFSERLTRLAASCRQELDDLTLEVYTEALCYQVEPDEWEAFTRQAVSAGRFQWFPKVVEVLDALREFRGSPPLQAEAAAAYERVIESGQYNPESGTNWSYRRVLETVGKAAADAFLSAGGTNAFATTWDESKRRERFLAAYVVETRAKPEAGLLPEPEAPKRLTGEVSESGRDFPAGGAFSRAEAVRIMRDIETKLPQPVITRRPVIVEATEGRLEMLRRQAEEIQKS